MVPLIALALIAQKPSVGKQYELTPGFFVNLPVAPVLKSKRDQKEKYWLAQTKEGVYVMGAYSVAQKGDKSPSDRILANMVAGYLAGSRGKLVEQRDIVLQGWPGVDIKIISGEGLVAWQRSYVVNDQAYQVSAMSLGESGNLPGSRAVFESVRLPGGQGPSKVAGPEFSAFSFPSQRVSVLLPGTPKIEDLPVKENAFGLVLHRASASYGNRVYASVYSDIPAEAKEEITPERMPATLEKVNLDVANSLQGKGAKSHTYLRGSETLLSTEFSAGDGTAYGRIDSMFVDGRLHAFLAVVPNALKASAEVGRYFGSIKIAPK